MQNPLPRVAAIHDLSGYGRCSLTVIIPILSTMGFEVCPLPTAVLSTHTGIEGFKIFDLTEQLPGFINHWKAQNLRFEAIYSGFLGSVEQADIVSGFIRDFAGPETLVVVDPVMADFGQLYASMPPAMIGEMRKLCAQAKVITPNITEAAFMLGREVPQSLSESEVKEWLLALADMGPTMPVITSLPLASKMDRSAVAAYNGEDKRFWLAGRPLLPTQYHGTGDIFSSVLTGSLLQGDSLPIALDRACHFVATAMQITFGYSGLDHHEILLERSLNALTAPVTYASFELLA
ncbi:MAG: pyridoxamine kinase [Deltaproteobacteria bacterium]|jgi:pyridoxine kinase|nr:pyridoxamine kinase [Deltaproteobacteria bacterium]